VEIPPTLFTFRAHGEMGARNVSVWGLRALAVVAVVLFHAFPAWLPGGFIGVDVFFVISGYLICGIIGRDLDAGTFTFRDFYFRRVRRIFPALVVVLSAILATGWLAMLAGEYRLLGANAAAAAAFASNLMSSHQAGYFEPAAATNPLLHLWFTGRRGAILPALAIPHA